MKAPNTLIIILILIVAGVGVWYFAYSNSIIDSGFNKYGTKNKGGEDFSQLNPVATSSDKKNNFQRNVLNPLPPTPSPTENIFTQYGPEGLWKEGVMVTTSHVMFPDQDLPVSIDFDEETIIVKDISIEKRVSDQKSGFSLYLTLSDDSRIGFRYTDPNPSIDTDGCLGYSSCGGVLAKEVEQREEEANDPRAEKKIVTESIGVVSVKYDFESDNWHSLKIGRLVYEELVYPSTIYSE